MNGASAASRRVSFQDDVLRRRFVGMTRSAPETRPTPARPSSILKKNRSVTVLHGRVVKQRDDGDGDGGSDNNHHAARIRSNESSANNRSSSIRDGMERKSTFYRLTEETQQFQNLVSKLEAVLKGDAGSAESAWRVRVLLKTAQDSDKSLWTKLYEFEKTLLSNDSSSDAATQNELRAAQTACMKLHRDFNLSHKALLMCSSLLAGLNSPTSATAPLTGAVGWTGMKVGQQQQQQEQGVDGNVLMRPLSPEPVYTSFREVKTKELFVYDENEDFGGPLIVEEGDVRYRAVDVETSSVEDSQCYERRNYLCGAFGFVDDDKSVQDSVDFYNRWYENLKEEFSSMQHDLLSVGKSLDCGAAEDDFETSSVRVASTREASFSF